MKVKELATTRLVCIDANSPVRDALKLMEKNRISRLLVTKNKKIVGIVTMKDIARRLGHEKERKISDAHIYVSSCYSKNLIKIDANASAKQAAKLMLKNKISSLAVEQNGSVVGIITKTDLLKALKNDKRRAEEFMHRKVTTIAMDARILEARKLMIAKNISRLVVVKGSKVIGIITQKDVANALARFRRTAEGKQWGEKMRHLTVAGAMTPNPITISPATPLSKVAEIMLANRISGLPVVSNDKLVGIITKTDLIKIIAKS